MTKQELIRAMVSSGDGSYFITASELVRFLGLSHPRYITRYVEGLDRVGGKRYFIPDVAGRIIGEVRR